MKKIIETIKEIVVIAYIATTVIFSAVVNAINTGINTFFENPIAVIITILQITVPFFGTLISPIFWLLQRFISIELFISVDKPKIFSWYLIFHIAYSLLLL